MTPDPGGEARALQLINNERANAGLPALRFNSAVASVARTWADFMARHAMQHNPDLAGDLQRAGVTSWHACGENVGNADSVDRVHALFMGSGSHRSNILSTQFTEVGIGVVVVGGHYWVTVDFIG